MASLAKVGIVAALVLGLLAAQIARVYHWNESIAYNALFFLAPMIFGYPSADQTLDEQAAHFAKTTANMEASATESSAKFMGDAIYQASFGENATQVVELTVPSATSNDYNIPVLCAAPQSALVTSPSLPVVLYFFGGGLVLGSPKGELLTLRWVALEANAVVCAPHYRLAPKYPYPVPIQDSIEGSIGILTNRKEQIETALNIRIDTHRVGSYGVSAGGYMSGQVARRLPEKGLNLRCQVLIAPMAKPHGGTQSATEQSNNRVWGEYKNSYGWNAFLPNDVDGTLAADWKVSLVADIPEDIWPSLAPAYIQILTQDFLRDEGEMYAKKLAARGKLIALDEFDTGHIGCLPGVSNGGPGDGAMAKAVQVLKQNLHSTTM